MSKRPKFAKDLAAMVIRRWDRVVGGRPTPPRPSDAALRRILEVLYQTSLETEEARPLRFMAIVTPCGAPVVRQQSEQAIPCMAFAADRTFDSSELRRLALTTNVDSSALWVAHDSSTDEVVIRGIMDVGTSWTSARRGFSQGYWSMPDALIVRVLRAGHLVVYQGDYAVARLRSGHLEQAVVDIHANLGVHQITEEGLDLLEPNLSRPKRQPDEHNWATFEFQTHLNSVAAIVNTMQGLGHGGILICTKRNALDATDPPLLKVKYPFSGETNHLATAFIEFVNAHHRYTEVLANYRKGGEQRLFQHELLASHRESELAHRCAQVGRFSAVDGAVVIESDFRVRGFGAEIRGSDPPAESVFYAVQEPENRRLTPYDLQESGMRHRSAARAAWALPQAAVYAVSQDGMVTTFSVSDRKLVLHKLPELTSSAMLWT